MPIFRWTRRSNFWSLGVRFLAKARVMSLEFLVSEASIVPELASENNFSPKNSTPGPPTTNNNHHHNHGRRWRKWPLSANTPRGHVGKSAVGTTGCYDLTLTTSHEIGQRWQTRGGDERRRRRMRNCDAVRQKAAKAETRSCLPVAEEK